MNIETTSPFTNENGVLVSRFLGETLQVEPWGRDGLRVRARPGADVVEPHVSALTSGHEVRKNNDAVVLGSDTATITNGRITAKLTVLNRYGAEIKREVVVQYLRSDSGEELLAETRSHFAGPKTRNFKGHIGGSFKLEATFKSYANEYLHGLGQPQHGQANLKGVSTTLMQQNAHAVIPFVVSSRGYGFLWNNPAVGRCEFASNLTRWTSDATPGMDYWITAGDNSREILNAYHDVTGHSPDIPDWALGFWQCKLRYRTQEELLSVAHEYKRRNLPLSCIVIDFFHWTRQGDWKFDLGEWPDPKRMVEELRSIGVEVMVSVWPTVSVTSENYKKMLEGGMLLSTDRGVPAVVGLIDKDPFGPTYLTYYDAFNPEARDFHWSTIKRNYIDLGIDHFWIDACEPEMRPAHPENVRTHLGNGAEMISAYPMLHEKRFREGLQEEGRDGVLLCRSAWAGSHAHGVILWSGDIWSNWEWFRAQIPAGLHAGMSGLGWWTTDIGGFYDGHGGQPEFRELLVRWFEFGVFSPICRLHGFRIPDDVPVPENGESVTYGEDTVRLFIESGGSNEVWSYGEDVEKVLTELLRIREALRPYLEECFSEFARTGAPVMAPIFYHFEGDLESHDDAGRYMLGPDLLVAPVLDADIESMKVALPKGEKWVHVWTGTVLDGGETADVSCPWGQCPVFIRQSADSKAREAFPALN
ncbi:MAG: glycoside hydrolase family 31 protein [Roseovarius sp.]|nr:glycoside hydrolase family 31 protein [Roseovarius sp.]